MVGDISTLEAQGAAGLDSIGAVRGEIKRSTQTTGASGNITGRISALDFTKGTLVLVMVLYHWLNYFVGLQSPLYRYLSFLPPSFICITGFLISHVYLSKNRISDRRLPRRLLIRGSKLLAIFILLNMGISVLIPGAMNGGRVFGNYSVRSLESVFVTGNTAGGRTVAFNILVPISYLLLFSALLLIAHRHCKQIFNALTLLCFLTIFILYVNVSESRNLELLTIGFLGISMGQISINRVNHFLKHPVAVIVAYLCYVVAITVWNSRYPLQVVGVLLTLCLIYLVGMASGETGRMQQWLILLGKYSLFGYIAQIAILQLIRRSLSMELTTWASGASFLAAIVLTILTVEVVDRGRAKSSTVDRLYAAVFS